MRRRLVLLSLATTVLVVVAFVVPLALLVRRQAAESAMVGAERDAQSVAALVALALSGSDDPGTISAAIGELPEGTIVVIDEIVLGEPMPGHGTLAAAAASTGATVASDVVGGWEIALPVVGGSEVAVVDSMATDSQLSSGVATAWLLLGVLGLLLVAVAVWVADSLGRRLTQPIEDLARSAHRLAEGDLEARVEPGEVEELRETGEAFNYLAERLDHLLAEERESAADLSHRLRTPLTSLRLQAEALTDGSERDSMVAQVDRLEQAMNQVIELARSRAAEPPGECRLDEVVAERVTFWGVLAEEQNREMSAELRSGEALVRVSPDAVGVVVDTLIGNVFSHTRSETNFTIRTGQMATGIPFLEVSDEGEGFSDRSEPIRGISGGGSTGLGLDIVRKIASGVDGRLQIDDRPGGGAVVRVFFG